MFRRTRDRLDRIERVLEQLATKLDAPVSAPPPSPDVLMGLLGKMMEANVDTAAAMGELAVRSVARRNGLKGGRRNAETAERERDGKFKPKNRRIERAPSCPLCVDPMTRNVDVPMIQAHRRHIGRTDETPNPNSTRGEYGGPQSHEPDENRAPDGQRNGATPTG